MNWDTSTGASGVGGDMQIDLLSETLAQYSALMVMEELYGADKIPPLPQI